MSRTSLWETVEPLASKVWEERDKPDGEYGDFVFLLPDGGLLTSNGDVNTVSLDGRAQGGVVSLPSLSEFCSHIVEIEYPDEYGDIREILSGGLTFYLGQLMVEERFSREATRE